MTTPTGADRPFMVALIAAIAGLVTAGVTYLLTNLNTDHAAEKAARSALEQQDRENKDTIEQIKLQEAAADKRIDRASRSKAYGDLLSVHAAIVADVEELNSRLAESPGIPPRGELIRDLRSLTRESVNLSRIWLAVKVAVEGGGDDLLSIAEDFHDRDFDMYDQLSGLPYMNQLSAKDRAAYIKETNQKLADYQDDPDKFTDDFITQAVKDLHAR